MASNSWDYMVGSINAVEHSSEMGRREAQYAADQAHRDSRDIQDRLFEANHELRTQNRSLEQIKELSSEGFKILAANSSTLNLLTEQGFENLASALGSQKESLVSIDEAIRNPKAVAAGEQFRIGLQVLRAGLLQEAKAAFIASIELDSLQPLTHLALGITLGALDDQRDAFQSFETAYRYSVLNREVKVHEAKDSLKALIVILASEVAYDDELLQKANRFCDELLNNREIPEAYCAELWLTSARVKHKLGLDISFELASCFRIAPELSLVAVKDELPNAREIAEAIYGEAMVQNAIKLEQLYDRLLWGDKTFQELNERHHEAVPPEPNVINSSGIAAWTSTRKDLSLYEDPAYAMVAYAKIASMAPYTYSSFIKDVEALEQEGQPLRRAQEKIDGHASEIENCKQAIQKLLASIEEKPGRFAKQAVKDDYAKKQAIVARRVPELEQQMKPHLEAYNELRENWPNVLKNQEDYGFRMSIKQEWLAIVPKAVTYRIKPFKLV